MPPAGLVVSISISGIAVFGLITYLLARGHGEPSRARNAFGTSYRWIAGGVLGGSVLTATVKGGSGAGLAVGILAIVFGWGIEYVLLGVEED